MNITIERNKWIRGMQGAVLMQKDGCGCVLGHIGLAYGITLEQLQGQGYPEDVREQREGRRDRPSDAWPAWVVKDGRETVDSHAIHRLNDNQVISDEERERDIAKIVAEHEVELVFTGEGKPA